MIFFSFIEKFGIKKKKEGQGRRKVVVACKPGEFV